MVPHHPVRARTLRAPTTLTERTMDTSEQMAKLKKLQTDLLNVLPERFELHEAFDVEQDLYIVLWDSNDEHQYILRPDTSCFKVITQLLVQEKTTGVEQGMQDVRGPIKAALGL